MEYNLFLTTQFFFFSFKTYNMNIFRIDIRISSDDKYFKTKISELN